MPLQKNVKSSVFWIKKNVKNVFSNYAAECMTSLELSILTSQLLPRSHFIIDR